MNRTTLYVVGGVVVAAAAGGAWWWKHRRAAAAPASKAAAPAAAASPAAIRADALPAVSPPKALAGTALVRLHQDIQKPQKAGLGIPVGPPPIYTSQPKSEVGRGESPPFVLVELDQA